MAGLRANPVMCIFIASTQFDDYNIYAPQDTSKSVGGTWMGLDQHGRFAILVNYHEQREQEPPFSRGELPTRFLRSTETASSWLEHFQATHAENFRECGGFTMMFGLLQLRDRGIEPLNIVSNRLPPSTVFNSNETVVYSNGVDASWSKLAKARKLVEPLFSEKNDLVSKLWGVLETSSIGPEPKIEDARRSIFIPIFSLRGREYGTRTSTIILVGYDGHVDYLEKDVLTQQVAAHSFKLK